MNGREGIVVEVATARAQVVLAGVGTLPRYLEPADAVELASELLERAATAIRIAGCA